MDPLRVLKRKWRRALVIGALFYVILFSSAYFSRGDTFARSALRARLEMNPLIRLLRTLIYTRQYYMAIHLIFVNNFVLVCFVYLTLAGLIPGLSVVILLFQAYSLGVYIGVMGVLESFRALVRMLPVLMMESVAYVLVAVSCLDVSISLMKPELIFEEQISRREAVITTLTELGYIYLIVAVILYAAAALEVLLIIYV